MKFYIGALVVGIILFLFGLLGYNVRYGIDAQPAANPVYLYISLFGLIVCVLSIVKIIRNK